MNAKKIQFRYMLLLILPSLLTIGKMYSLYESSSVESKRMNKDMKNTITNARHDNHNDLLKTKDHYKNTFKSKSTHQQLISKNSTSKLCSKSPHLCEYSDKVNDIMKYKKKYIRDTTFSENENIRIYIETDTQTFFGSPEWLTSKALVPCTSLSKAQCIIINNMQSANVVVSTLYPSPNRDPAKLYANINLEPVFFDMITNSSNVAVISFRHESDVEISYGYTLLKQMGLCIFSQEGKKNHETCENRTKFNRVLKTQAETPNQYGFANWCSYLFAGDFYSCLFNAMDHIVRTNEEIPKTNALAATWISATCERHDLYLKKLMQYIKIDSMGGCYKNRDELSHPALTMKDRDKIWSEHEKLGSVCSNSCRKILIASQYKFFLSFENTILDDYVTEKFYEGFLANTVMVYLGAPNAKQIAPHPSSFIDAIDFGGPEELANFLIQLSTDNERYDDYNAWKRQSPVKISERFRNTVENDITRMDDKSLMCRLCNMIS